MPPDPPHAPATRLQAPHPRSAAGPGAAPRPGSLGFVLPTFPQGTGALIGASELADTCRRAEAAGASALWACDHLYWHGPALEALAALGVAATATSRATVGTCVLQLPLRHPASVAKEAATLSHLAGGRLVLGVGVGVHPGEYDAAGSDFATRGPRLDTGIDALRAAWAPEPQEHYAQLPSPPSIPIWIGGSSETALRRAARRGDGWIPLFLDHAEYRGAMERLDKEADREGRDPHSVARAIVAFVAVGDHDDAERGLAWMGSLYGLPARSFERHLLAGDARHCAQALARYAEAGAQHVAVFLTADRPLVQFEDLAGEFAGLTACSAAGVADGADASGLDATGRSTPGAYGRTRDPLRR